MTIKLSEVEKEARTVMEFNDLGETYAEFLEIYIDALEDDGYTIIE